MNSTNEELKRITSRVSMAALTINPKNPRVESVLLLKDLNTEMEAMLDELLNSK